MEKARARVATSLRISSCCSVSWKSMPGILAQDASGGRRGHAPARRRPTRDAKMSRHGGPGALLAADRLPGLRALRALLRRLLEAQEAVLQRVERMDRHAATF